MLRWWLALIGHGVGPFALEGRDEAFGLAVGMRGREGRVRW
jgi:hypothetical protein